MTPPLLHAEVDTFQVAIIVLAVIFSFLKWLWEQWTGNKLQLPDEPEEPDRTEELRRQLQEQARRRAATAPQPPPIPASPPPVPAAPWEEIRKAWREVREAAQAQKQQSPPVRAAQRQQPPPVQKVAEAVQKPLPVPVVTPTAPAVVQTSTPNAMLTSLRALRHDPAAMRRAIVLGEVLGPPKALQG